MILQTSAIMNVEKIDSRYRLLHLIYQGKTSGILADHALRDSLNDLMKHDLITINNNKLSLTERGKIALQKGVNSVLTKVRKTPDPDRLDPEQEQLTILMATISVLLLVILLFLIL